MVTVNVVLCWVLILFLLLHLFSPPLKWPSDCLFLLFIMRIANLVHFAGQTFSRNLKKKDTFVLWHKETLSQKFSSLSPINLWSWWLARCFSLSSFFPCNSANIIYGFYHPASPHTPSAAPLSAVKMNSSFFSLLWCNADRSHFDILGRMKFRSVLFFSFFFFRLLRLYLCKHWELSFRNNLWCGWHSAVMTSAGEQTHFLVGWQHFFR